MRLFPNLLRVAMCFSYLTIFMVGCVPKRESQLVPISLAVENEDSEITKKSCPIMAKILAKRDSRSFTNQLNETIEAITIQSDTKPGGVFAYEQLKYPGDIAISESLFVPLKKEDAKIYYAARLSNLAERIAANADIILLDFRAGIDTRLTINIGENSGGTVSGYDAKLIKERILKLKDEALINEDEKNNLEALAKENLTFAEWAEFKETTQLLQTIRWSLDELMSQEKMLAKEKKISLADALENSLVKITVFAPVTTTEGYKEISNLFTFIYQDNGQAKSLSEKQKASFSLSQDILKHLSKANKNLLKATTRLWSEAVALQDNELAAALFPVLGSAAAALNEVVAEAAVIRALVAPERVLHCVPVGHRLLRQITSFDKRIINNTNILDVELLSNQDNGLIREIFDAFQKDCPVDAEVAGPRVLTDSTKALIADNLKAVENSLKPEINRLTKELLQKIGIDWQNPLSALTGRQGVCPKAEPLL